MRRLWAALLLIVHSVAAGATLTVTNIADAGAGTLRQAILDANANPGPDAIGFDLAGSPPFSINLAAALPPIFETVTLDASTQPGYSGSPLVVLNGASTISANGLTLSSAGNIVRGLVIQNFPKYGIEALSAASGSNIIQGCFIGTDSTGLAAQPNSFGGIHIGASSYNLVGGASPGDRNIISGNGNDGIWIDGSPNSAGNVIVGNLIGVKANGTAALANLKQGIRISLAQSTTVGGNTAAARNVVSGNGESGVTIEGATSTNNVVQGNFIGVNSAGTAAISNGQWGVRLLLGARLNTIGGTNAGDGNVISGNAKSGIDISTGARDNAVQGNLIGTSKFGSSAVANGERGITMSGATNNVVGGTTPGARNVIAGNLADGIQLYDAGARSNRVEGNFIGMDATGTNKLGNGGAGVWITNAPANFVGSSISGGGNVISGNAASGVYLQSAGATGNQVLGNLIGTDAAGMVGVGNGTGYYGVVIDRAPANFIGGVTPYARNVISSNNTGIDVRGTGSSNNVIQGNYIGTDITGLNKLGNLKDGIAIGYPPVGAEIPRNNIIGGAVAGAGNVVAANGTPQINGVDSYRPGIAIIGAVGTVVQGNRIGVAADGVTPLGNIGHNVELELATNTIVGGSDPLAWNIIAHVVTSDRSGIRVRSGIGNAVLGNSIYSNGNFGISLNGVSALANDVGACDADTGQNGKQNFPVLLSGVTDGLASRVRGYLDSVAGQTYTLQFYASPAADPSGRGEGKVYLGSGALVAGGSCSNSFALNVPVGAPVGWVVSATATDASNNTSEFSPTIPLTGVPQLQIEPAVANQSSVSWLVTNSFGGVWQLVQASNLTPPVAWFNVPGAPSVTSNGIWFTMPVSSTNAMRFFRLQYQ